MPQGHEREQPELPEPAQLFERIARELGLDAKKKPTLFEGLPEERLYPEEAPTFEGRYLAGACLEQICDLVLRHTLPGAPILLSRGDVRWIHQQFRQGVEEAWDLPEPLPEVTLTHLLGAARRRIAHLSDLRLFHETDVYDPAIETYSHIGFVIERAICDGDPDPQYLGQGET